MNSLYVHLFTFQTASAILGAFLAIALRLIPHPKLMTLGQIGVNGPASSVYLDEWPKAA